MKMSAKTVVLAALASAFILALVVSLGWVLSGGEGTAQANAGVVTTMAIDMDPNDGGGSPVNDEDTVGNIDPCWPISNAAGQTVTFDVVTDAIPLTVRDGNVSGFQYVMMFDSAFTVTARDHTTAGVVLLHRNPGGWLPMDMSAGMTSPPWTPPVAISFSDLNAAGIEGNGESPANSAGGVLGRYTLTYDGTLGNAQYVITMVNASYGGSAGPIYDDPTSVGDDDNDGGIDEDILLDGAAGYAIIAVGVDCPAAPEYADVEKLLFEPVGLAGWPGSVELAVCTETTFQLHERLVLNTNVGAAVGTDITITACPQEAGLKVSYHVTADDLALPGDLVVTLNDTPIATNPTVSSMFYAEYPDCLDVHKQVDLTYDTPVDLYEDWDLHCLEPSTHSIQFDNDIVPKSPYTDNVENNHLDLDFDVTCLAYADFEVVGAGVNAPTSEGQGATFPVVVSANVNNTGPDGPATVDATFDLSLSGTATCIKDPVGSQTVTGITLINGAGVSPDATWQVTCTSLGTADFDGDISVALASGQPHISDPDPTDDSDSASDSTDITASADVIVRVGSAEVLPAGTKTVRLETLDVPDPGLGAYVVDVSYDSSVVIPVDCDEDPDDVIISPHCNIEFAPGVVRCGGFHSTEGLTGQVALCDITFEAVGETCQTSALLLSVEEFFLMDGSAPPVHIENGSIHVGAACGDVDCNDSVQMLDAMMIAQYIMGLRCGGEVCDAPGPDQCIYLPAADVDCNGLVQMLDAMLVAQCVMGLIDCDCHCCWPCD